MNNKPKILIADDEPLNIKLLEANLSPEGYQVIPASDGNEVFKILEENNIDLILLDVMMPGLNGFEVTQRIRAGEKNRLTPIVLVTSLKDISDRIKGIESGCDDFISKPFDREEILARVRSLIKLNHYRSLLDEKEKFEYVVEHTADGVVVFSRDFKMTRASRAARGFLGIDGEVSADFDFLGYMKGNFKIHGQEHLNDFFRKDAVWEMERPADGDRAELFLQLKTTVIRNPLGDISSIIVLVADVTGSRLEEKFKENFLTVISGKLRNPLNNISEALHSLRSGSSEEQRPVINKAMENLYLLTALAEELVNFSLITSQDLDLPRETIALCDYLPLLVAPVIKLSLKKNIALEIDCLPGVSVNINRVYFDLIIGNLVDNAIKFCDEREPKIKITAASNAGKTEISVIDNGAGIPAQEQGRIFEKFYQVNNAEARNQEGAGLGLALVKRLVEAHGGQIKVCSRTGEGAAFIFTLP